MLQDLQKLAQRASELGNRAVEISAAGSYPENHTRVQNVAKWQNDGTGTISPARFVERAETKANGWKQLAGDVAVDFIDGTDAALDRLGERIARDINRMCDRIKTRRLKHSMRHLIKTD